MRPLALSVISLLLSAQDSTLVPILSRVRIHPNQAWLTRESQWTFKGPGSQRLRLTGLPPDLTLEDVRVQAEGIPGLRIGNIAITRPKDEPEKSSAAQALEGEIGKQSKLLADIKLRLDTIEEALAALENLKPDGAAGGPGNLPDPRINLELSRSIQARVAELLGQSSQLRRDQHAGQKRLAVLQEDLGKLERADTRSTSVISIELEAPLAGETRIQVHSRTEAARWLPTYEVRLGDKGLELLCYASVSQASGEDWRGVGLEISNAEPSRALRVPAPPPPVQVLYEAPGVQLSGRIEGRVIDRRGRPVAGVAVEVSNEILKLKRVVVSDAKGIFRFAILPVGEYVVRSHKEGFSATANLAKVAAGQTTTLGIQMGTTAGAVVEVVADAASVDATSVTTATNFSTEQLRGVAALENTPSHYEETGEFSRVWMLDGKRDLPSDASSRRILLARTSHVPKLRLTAIPRSSSEVFDVATLPPVQGFPWFPGIPTAVFKNGEQLGKVALPRLQGGEGAHFSFGPVPGLRVQRQRIEATVATPKGGRNRQWTLRERVTLINSLDHEVTVEVQEPLLRSGSDRVKVMPLPEATPGTDKGEKQVWQISVPARGEAHIDEGWRILGPLTGSVPEIVTLGLPTSD